MTNRVETKRQINWRLPYCGGADIHGTPSCFYDEEKDEWKCECECKPVNYNYEAHFYLATEIEEKKCHLNTPGQKIGKKWEDLQRDIFGPRGRFQSWKPIEAETLKSKFTKMLKEIEGRHGLVSGFETHASYDANPDGSPYDTLMLKLYYEIQNQEKEEEEKKEKKKSADQATLYWKEVLCSPLNSKGQVRLSTPRSSGRTSRGRSSSTSTRTHSNSTETDSLESSILEFADVENANGLSETPDYHGQDHRLKRNVDTGEADNGFLTMVGEMRKLRKTEQSSTKESDERNFAIREQELANERDKIALQTNELAVRVKESEMRAQEAQSMRDFQLRSLELMKEMMDVLRK
jgi:hypothetical protein